MKLRETHSLWQRHKTPLAGLKIFVNWHGFYNGNFLVTRALCAIHGLDSWPYDKYLSVLIMTDLNVISVNKDELTKTSFSSKHCYQIYIFIMYVTMQNIIDIVMVSLGSMQCTNMWLLSTKTTSIMPNHARSTRADTSRDRLPWPVIYQRINEAQQYPVGQISGVLQIIYQFYDQWLLLLVFILRA